MTTNRLTHTHATFLLESDVPMKVIQERLGHKTMAVTQQVYSHVTEKMNHKAKENFDNFIKDSNIFKYLTETNLRPKRYF
ncbi:tyrosine-type recombinase/integrase [Staphylococcus coagulans]|uniref:tyrosine-type recombinase/integrase n=1 Tax=Staphylococcus coagulans TaxID=74706 RepID=UPI001FD8A5CA|nr:tyrosine-type recombinase/integrase [Staphylococcus coagulans]MDU9267846.1 tyrosine-type recombinase/integrase [Staphylococcus coagulans]MDU9279744.1 tyrosine-type recombinase/integrase [Staphylococcus coagulans]MDU9291788.1 tyrosine-type recombinase/integrase [Staphylococcus coagulans]MDU9304110.1 tyrosine-type recombinase/integrase [Staphylococcus coagulans]MDU9321169.1 tyrosine-type recombinase/integrase [Staphylococcus coagulans]